MNRYEIIIYWSNEDNAFIAEVPELAGCMAHGNSYEEALANAKEAIHLWIDTAKEFGDPGYRKGYVGYWPLAKIISGFIAELRREIPIKEIILFGSYAQGNPKEYSDIDLAVISDWFVGKPKIENMQYLSRIAAAYNSLIEALPFTEEEYRNLDKRSFLASIVKSGRNSSELIEKR
jgi:predicted RNase H-like HicB family nuclease/predicted nucleotidyltransferase